MIPSFDNFFPDAVLALTTDHSVDFQFLNTEEIFNAQQSRFLETQTGFEISRIVTIHQEHGACILKVSGEHCQQNENIPRADGLITQEENVVLTIRTADCLPVFLYDPTAHAIGLIHAGWRGSQKRITVKAVELMQEWYGTKSQDLKAAFGPAIRQEHYHVGEEFVDIFPEEVFKKSDGFYLDLPLVNRNQLLGIGVREKNIFDCNICTYQDPQYFSYRRDGEQAGRMLSLMMVKKEE